MLLRHKGGKEACLTIQLNGAFQCPAKALCRANRSLRYFKKRTKGLIYGLIS